MLLKVYILCSSSRWQSSCYMTILGWSCSVHCPKPSIYSEYTHGLLGTPLCTTLSSPCSLPQTNCSVCPELWNIPPWLSGITVPYANSNSPYHCWKIVPSRELVGRVLGLKVWREYSEFTVVQTELPLRKEDEFGSNGQYPVWNM